MDAIDRKILTVLQDDASLSVAEIGNRVGLSSTPCWKRIQRLEAEGVITRRVALVDQDKIGLGITVFVSIETGDHSQDWLERFAVMVSAMPEVMEFYRMAGDVDYMLRVVVPDIQGYDGDIVVVRLYYQWPVYLSLLGFNLADISDNKRLLVATAAFRNEPFQ